MTTAAPHGRAASAPRPTHVISVAGLTSPLPLDALFDPSLPLEVEIGCGNGRFLAARASAERGVQYLGIERMLGRVRKLDRKAARLGLSNLRILRLEAFYTFYYLLPPHRVRAVYVFFPDPWPKRHHHGRRLFSPLFLDALWARLEVGGAIQVATDHLDYFGEIRKAFAADARFREVAAMARGPEEQTDFELLFRRQGLPIGQCAFQSLPADERPLPPLELDPAMLPRAERGAGDCEPEEDGCGAAFATGPENGSENG
jgi:tRNA (guanine-N7-)-methyltransferase